MSRKSSRLQEEKSFRSLVLLLHQQNPSWTIPDIGNFFEQSDNPPDLSRHSLLTKIRRTLARGSSNDKKRSGRPPTTMNSQFQEAVVKEIRTKHKASVRNVAAKLTMKGWKTSRSSVHRAARKAGLKWYKRTKSQKLTDFDKTQRVKCAKRLLRKFGITKRSKMWKWNLIINTDFSGKFTLESFSNPHNEGIWAKNIQEIPTTLRNRPKQKFSKGVVFWGGISYQGLVPRNGPIDVTSWLAKQQTHNKRKKSYMTSQLYGKFMKKVAYKQIQKMCGQNVIFQDDQDKKHRTFIALQTIDELFTARISPEDGDAKFGDIWPIENVWGMLKEKLRGIEFTNVNQLKNAVNKEWKKISCDDCRKMIDKIPNRLQKVINSDAQQISDG